MMTVRMACDSRPYVLPRTSDKHCPRSRLTSTDSGSVKMDKSEKFHTRRALSTCHSPERWPAVSHQSSLIYLVCMEMPRHLRAVRSKTITRRARPRQLWLAQPLRLTRQQCGAVQPRIVIPSTVSLGFSYRGPCKYMSGLQRNRQTSSTPACLLSHPSRCKRGPKNLRTSAAVGVADPAGMLSGRQTPSVPVRLRSGVRRQPTLPPCPLGRATRVSRVFCHTSRNTSPIRTL